MKKSVSELQRELDQLDAGIRRARDYEIGTVMDRILKIMSDWSISIAELDRYRRAQRRRLSEAPPYRDPITGQTWSGRGRPPKWFAQQDGS